MENVIYATLHPPHGYLGPNCDFTDICPTIDANIMKWHTLILEVRGDVINEEKRFI